MIHIKKLFKIKGFCFFERFCLENKKDKPQTGEKVFANHNSDKGLVVQNM